jgi:hypothetical protein
MTVQMHETLILDGHETFMMSYPLVPEGHPRIRCLDLEEVKARGLHQLLSSACWRNYLATWEVRDGRFYLRRLQGKYELIGKDPLLADWFTGTLTIPKGNVLYADIMGLALFEEELHLTVEKGVIVGSRSVDNRSKFLRSKFPAKF